MRLFNYKKFVWVFHLCLLPLVLCLFSCSEKDEVSEFDNWRDRNQAFIDSIARVAQTNADGSWEIIKAFNLGDDASLYQGMNNYFIYVKKLEVGTGTYSPMYVDSVRIHYIGRLIPTAQHPQGKAFGKSYSTNELNETTDVPTIFCVNQNLVVGISTALMHMHEGDRWLVYIPYYLGYGATDYTKGAIPAYSALVYDLKLARIYRYKIDTDTAWH
ncbi:MAG: FKBP-type peptidyl-prolyl cis-trans isomerase [Bacteroidaceae bacterium]|nr:FKBP-type peptidyl-prolyl cis-trans isomerase [Bacteroidaceae bacterium]